MPKFKFEEIDREITKGRLYPVYLIHGPEDFFIRMTVDKITRVFKAETDAEVERHTGKVLDMPAVINSLKTISMWSKGKLVIISDASSLSPKAKEELEAYLQNSAASTVLVLVAEKFDARSKLYKIIVASGAVVEIKTLYENQIPFWITKICKAKGVAISREAASYMTELVGTDLSQISAAVEKIVLFIGDKRMIDLKDVEAVLSDTSQKSVFDLTKAVGLRDLAQATNRLNNLFRNNEPPVMVLVMIARHWRSLLKTHQALASGRTGERELAPLLGCHPFFVKDYIQQSRGFTRQKLEDGLKKLYFADVAVKSSRLPKEEILYKLVKELVT